MRTRVAHLIALALAGTAPHAVAAPATAEAREAAIRAYIEELAGPTRFPTMPIKIELTFEMASQRSAEEASQIMAKYADRPDHPERVEWEHHARLHARPEVETSTLVFSSDTTWFLDWTNTPSSRVLLGERSGIRWMWFDGGPSQGAMTITKAGVPFPASSDIGGMRAEVLRRVRMLTNAGLYEEPLSVIDLDVVGAEWRATTESVDQRSEFHLSGDWVGDAPRVKQIDEVIVDTSDGSSRVGEPISLAYRQGEAVATGAFRLRYDDVTERVRLTRISSVSAREVESAATMPDPLPEGVYMMDWRRGSPEPSTGQPRTLLVFQPGRDARLLNHPVVNQGDQPASGQPTEKPGTANSAQDIHHTRGSWIPFGIGAVVIVGGAGGAMLLLRRRMS